MQLMRLGFMMLMLTACGENRSSMTGAFGQPDATIFTDAAVNVPDMGNEQDAAEDAVSDTSVTPDLNVSITDVGSSAQCGNGVIEVSETCDDGNLQPEDGCAPDCQVEPEYSCRDEPSDCRPTDPCSPNHNPCSEHAGCIPSDWQAVCTCDEEFYGNGLTCTALTACTSNEYETVPPGPNTDRVCTPLTVCNQD